jgi:ATP-dependent phosphofructokinase / diphosphate-dependent phosphofructokinase
LQLAAVASRLNRDSGLADAAHAARPTNPVSPGGTHPLQCRLGGRSVAHRKDRLAILVGGGPAPGINSVIGAATIRAALEGGEVLGIEDGFEWIMQGDIDHVTPLTIEATGRIHFQGGSCIGISRATPTEDPHQLETSVLALLRLGVSQLITIGGDTTAFAAMKLEECAAGRIRVVHVPKTIDNDLPLSPWVDTFGFQTARHLGVEIVKNLMVDARATARWYFVIVMGRRAGHLALGIGKAAGATLTLIAEEHGDERVRLRTLIDTLAGAVIKRLAHDRRDGVAVISEGLASALDPAELDDVHLGNGNGGVGEPGLGAMLRRRVAQRLRTFGLRTGIVAKDIGYELRCADPIPFDMEYARDLGYCAAGHLLEGGNAALISMEGGQLKPIPFKDLIDADTGRTRVRLVNVSSTRYAVAQRYMIRLEREDFDNPQELARLAAVCRLSIEEFRDEFAHVVAYHRPSPR